MKTLEDLIEVVNGLEEEEYNEIFTPYSYYNTSFEGALKLMEQNIEDFYMMDEDVEYIEENMEDIQQLIFEKHVDWMTDDDWSQVEEDGGDSWISFEWYNVLYFFKYGKLRHNHYFIYG